MSACREIGEKLPKTYRGAVVGGCTFGMNAGWLDTVHCTGLHCTAAQCCTMQFSVVQFFVVQFSAVQLVVGQLMAVHFNIVQTCRMSRPLRPAVV